MDEIQRLEKRIDELDTLVRQLQTFVNSPRFVPTFTKRMMWAMLAISLISLIVSAALFYEVYLMLAKAHDIYTLLLSV